MRMADERAGQVERAHEYLRQAGRPRLAMVGMLMAAGAAGFVASAAMVRVGVGSMAVRYPLAVGVAYAALLGVLWAWLRRQRAAGPVVDDPEGLLLPGLAAGALAKLATGPESADDQPKGRWWDSIGDVGNFGDVGDVGAGCASLVVLVLVAAACTVIVSAYLVATSPLLLAELMVDGAVLGTIARALGPEPPSHWSRAVLRRTALAALITAVIFGLVGAGIDRAAPGASTLGEAWAMTRDRR